MIAKAHYEARLLKLDQAIGKVLAEDISATEDIPNKSEATMDGYAIRMSDMQCFGGRFVLHGLPGTGGDYILPHGAAVYVRNGGMIPKGSDTVIRVEKTDRRGDTDQNGEGEVYIVREKRRRPVVVSRKTGGISGKIPLVRP